MCLGKNAPAIAAAEATYEQMWAADVAAMVELSRWGIGGGGALAPWRQAVPVLVGLARRLRPNAPAATHKALHKASPS
ncbi:PPE domain-containing protein [Mycobacterium tuberculosis]